MAPRDYYEVLGVSRNASSDDIKAAFRQLARQYHPDVNNASDAEERFKEINEAFVVLSDPSKRAAYDQYGAAGVSGMGGIPDYGAMDLSELFEELFGFASAMGGSRHRQQQQRRAPRRGADLAMDIQLTFEEAAFGVEKPIEITRDEPCAACKGSGVEPGSKVERCPTCNGRGEVRQVQQTLLGQMVQVTTCPTCGGAGERVEQHCRVCRGRGLERKVVKRTVPIPAGVNNGTQIRMAGEGQPGIYGGPNGSLYLTIQVSNHKYFRRKNEDIMVDLTINIAQATLGAEVDVPTLEGTTKVTIPAGTQPGKIITLKGKGIPILQGNGRGDQLIVINVSIPTQLTAEQRKLMEELAGSLGTEVRPTERSLWDILREVWGG